MASEIINNAFLVSAGVQSCNATRSLCNSTYENGFRVSGATLTNNSGYISKSCALKPYYCDGSTGIGNSSIFDITFTDGTAQTYETTADDLVNYLGQALPFGSLNTIKICNFKQIKSTVIDITNLFNYQAGRYWFVSDNMTDFICEACLKNVTNMYGTWQNCASMTSFPLIDTSSVTDMNSTWDSCNSMTSFPLIDTSSVTDMNSTWDSCTSLTSFGGVSDCTWANSTTWANTSLLNPKPCGQ